MKYTHSEIASTADILRARYEDGSGVSTLIRSPELTKLFEKLKSLPHEQRSSFGRELNYLKGMLEQLDSQKTRVDERTSIDVTAPMDINNPRPGLSSADMGSVHPITQEIDRISDIFAKMGFHTEESREIDDQFHMFESLNFPKGHPARDDYDTFMTEQTDDDGDAYIAPAHTSTMQQRVLLKHSSNFKRSEPIAVIVPDRVFRNEDLDARHEHTFYQVEGVYVDKNVHAGMLIATLQAFLEDYYGTELQVRVNPYYFPFTEPSFEFSLSCPFCNNAGDSSSQSEHCKVCSDERWIELLGCGMIHPNVLKAAEIDPEIYTGFAFGCGIDRLVMMKYAIEDIRHFHSGKLEFLRQF